MRELLAEGRSSQGEGDVDRARARRLEGRRRWHRTATAPRPGTHRNRRAGGSAPHGAHNGGHVIDDKRRDEVTVYLRVPRTVHDRLKAELAQRRRVPGRHISFRRLVLELLAQGLEGGAKGG